MAAPDYAFSVFVNCPFDAAYRPLLEAIVFAVHDCGYVARCSLEIDDSSEVRIEKVARIIAACRLGIHDISRTELDPASSLPRFNMPLELGLYFGAKRFGRAEQKSKVCLILDTEHYRYQKFISDIAGQDISAHSGEPVEAIKAVRNYLRGTGGSSAKTPGGAAIAKRYELFRAELPLMCEKLKLVEAELTFADYVVQVEEWLKLNTDPAR
jgi:hypothetical protein